MDEQRDDREDDSQDHHVGIQRKSFRRREDYEAHAEILAIREAGAARQAEMAAILADVGLLKLEMERTRDVLLVLTTDGNSALLREFLEEMKQRRQRREAIRNRFVGMLVLAPLAVAIAWMGRHLEEVGAWVIQWWKGG